MSTLLFACYSSYSMPVDGVRELQRPTEELGMLHKHPQTDESRSKRLFPSILTVFGGGLSQSSVVVTKLSFSFCFCFQFLTSGSELSTGTRRGLRFVRFVSL